MNRTTDPQPAGVFDEYARFYDLLYKDKDYAAEARFIHDTLIAQGPRPRRLLELGCGTGRHAVELARLGHEVTGVDLSPGMVAQATARAAQLSELRGALRFQAGDVRSVRVGEKFDAVLSLFHVMSYQTSDADLRAAFATAAEHLPPGGLFLFDFWHGPAVLADPPVVRVKRLGDDMIEATRLAEPVHDPARHQVVVNYHVFLKNRRTGAISEVREAHPMRYLFLPELTQFLGAAGLAVISSGAWRSARPLGPDAWYGWVVARKE